MKQKYLLLLVSCLLTALMLTGCTETSSSQNTSTDNVESIEESESQPESEEDSLDSSDDLESDGYRCEIPKLNGSISVPNGYYVFGEDISYTDEMCHDIGIEPENMELAMPALGGQAMIVPSDVPYRDNSITIYLKVKEKKYEDITLSSLSELAYHTVASTVVSSFGTNDYDTVEGNGLRFFVFKSDRLGNYCRYATILNGHMIYVAASTGDVPITEEQQKVLEYIALSIQHEL